VNKKLNQEDKEEQIAGRGHVSMLIETSITGLKSIGKISENFRLTNEARTYIIERVGELLAMDSINDREIYAHINGFLEGFDCARIE
jgi:hypothetical protein